MTMILMQHGYSALNSGDRLLVDLSLKYVRAALGPDSRIALIANDADSFGYLRDVNVIQNPPTSPDLYRRFKGLVAGASSFGGCLCDYQKLVGERVDLVVGVGGGYLRGRGCSGFLKFGLAMFPQLNWAANVGIPSIYLPQSIGPFPEPFREIIGKQLSRLHRVYVRDDRSHREWSQAGVIRVPDLAVMELARKMVDLRVSFSESRRAIIIARDLAGNESSRTAYRRELKRLADALSRDYEVIWALQSAGRGNNDQSFYADLGVGCDTCLPANEAFRRYPDAMVISVRLHGSLEALLHGLPTYHLSYERKGFSAMADLGLDDCVSSAFSFDGQDIAEKAGEMNRSRPAYWERIEERCETIREQYSGLRDAIAETLTESVNS